MQTLGLDRGVELPADNDPGPADISDTGYTGFWKRQFGKQATRKQLYYDWIFGVILPVVCFAFDPFLFKSSHGPAFLGALKPFAYILSYVSIMAMMAWLLFGTRLKWLNALLAGLFAVGGTVSLLVGIFLLPFSLLGLVILIGALGFTPIFTSVIYLRNAVRAYRAAGPFIEKRVLLPTFLLSALFSVVVPVTINSEIRNLMFEIKLGNEHTSRIETAKLKYVGPLIDPEEIAARFHSIRPGVQSERKKVLAEAYEGLTGRELVERTDYWAY